MATRRVEAEPKKEVESKSPMATRRVEPEPKKEFEIKSSMAARRLEAEPKKEEMAAELRQSKDEDDEDWMHSVAELDCFAEPYSATKFARAAPAVPSYAPVAGLLPRMGRKDERKAGIGGSCPLCSARFPDQAALLVHIDSCAATSSSGSSASFGFVSGPTNVTHETTFSGNVVVSKKLPPPKGPAPKAPAPKPPVGATGSRARSRSGGESSMKLPEAPAPLRGPASVASRRRSVSIGSVAEPKAVEEEEEEIASLEMIFFSGDVSLEALNAALGSRAAADAEVCSEEINDITMFDLFFSFKVGCWNQNW